MFVFLALSQNSQLQEKSAVPGLIQVKFRRYALERNVLDLSTEDVGPNELKQLLSNTGFTRGRKIFPDFNAQDTLSVSRSGDIVKLRDLSTWYILKVADTTNVVALSERLMQLPEVIAATPVHKVDIQDVYPDDPNFEAGLQWGLYNSYNPGKDIHAPAAWEYNTGSSDVTIAVIDGGIDYNHDDLDPGNRSRVITGTDTGDDDNDPLDNAPDGGASWGGHGTKVAGVIGAITDNDYQVSGVIWDVKLMPVKVAKNNQPWWGPIFGFEAGQSLDSDIAAGIDYARTNGADIINMSFGSSDGGFWESVGRIFTGNPIAEATYNAYASNILLVAAMGNDGGNIATYPAAYEWVMAIGATDYTDTRASFSNYGNWINVVAPGVGHYSTWRGGGSGTFGGTSCSTPIVAGVAGLILSESQDNNLNLTNDDIWHLIEQTCDDRGDQGFDNEYGYGRVNAAKALEALQPPNVVTHATAYGGSSQLVWQNHTQTFVG